MKRKMIPKYNSTVGRKNFRVICGYSTRKESQDGQ